MVCMRLLKLFVEMKFQVCFTITSGSKVTLFLGPNISDIGIYVLPFKHQFAYDPTYKNVLKLFYIGFYVYLRCVKLFIKRLSNNLFSQVSDDRVCSKTREKSQRMIV